MIYSPRMSRATVELIQSKTALNRVTGMPFAWSLNPYRGCAHACCYCYARATHAYHGLNAGDDFSTRLFAKVNLPDLLRAELARRGWSGESVAIGTATDPYQPIEGRLRITRDCLAVFRDARNPISVTTKSTLVLRDLDLLADLAAAAEVRVNLSITTLDHDRWRAVEPGTPPPLQRLAALARLRAAGIPAGVFLSPILPGITDSAESIEAIAAAARDHGALWLWVAPLRLAPLVKEHYLAFVEREFPDLTARYHRSFPAADAPRDYVDALRQRADRIRGAYGFTSSRASLPSPAPPAAVRRDGQLPLL